MTTTDEVLELEGQRADEVLARSQCCPRLPGHELSWLVVGWQGSQERMVAALGRKGAQW